MFPGVVLGAAPQDRSHAGEPTELVVGDDNVFRENATTHRGTVKGLGVTTIGSHGLFMVGSHVAHDCRVGDRVTIANNTSLGGHVSVADGVVFGGHVAVAPFVRIGRLSFVAGGSMVERDVPPFVIAEGNRARVRALNQVGLERAGIGRDATRSVERAFRLLFGRGGVRAEALRVVRAELGHDPLVAELLGALDGE
jgi:UDP-N-acetylglucosamine acyltransferase